MGELDPILIDFLKLDGSNANQNIDIGSYDLTTTGDLFASNCTLTGNLTVDGTLFFDDANTYIRLTDAFPQKWLFNTNRNMDWNADNIDIGAIGSMDFISAEDMTFQVTGANRIVAFQAGGGNNEINFDAAGDIQFNPSTNDTDISWFNQNKLLMKIFGDDNTLYVYDDVSVSGDVTEIGRAHV